MRHSTPRRHYSRAPRLEPLEPRTLLSVSGSSVAIDTGSLGNGSPLPPLGNLTALGSTLLFVNNDQTHGPELWRSDGSPDGTALVKDIRPGFLGGLSLRPTTYTIFPNFDNALVTTGPYTYFLADDGTHGRELWRTDGTAAGTILLRDILPGASSSYPGGLTPAGDHLFFFASPTANGPRQLWTTDGTPAGTRMLRDFTGAQWVGTHPNLVWKLVNGSMQLVLEGDPGANTSAHILTTVGDTLFFIVQPATGPNELWKSDGTPAGTARIPTAIPLEYSRLYAAGARLYVEDGTGHDLYAVDPANPAAPARVINLDVNGSLLDPIPFGDQLLVPTSTYSSTDLKHYTFDLYLTDGTRAGTRHLFRTTDYFEPTFQAAAAGRFAFFAPDHYHLYRTDGTAEGTSPLRPDAYLYPLSDFTPLDGQLYFRVAKNTLWRSDGNDRRTRPVATLPALPSGTTSASDTPPPYQFTAAAHRLFFIGDGGRRPAQLWTHNPASPRKPFRPLPAPRPAATLSAGRLTVDGTNFSDSILLTADPTAATLQVTAEGLTLATFPLNNVTSVLLRGQAGDDTLTLAGPVPRATLLGNDGNDTLTGGDLDDQLYGFDAGVLTSVNMAADNNLLLGGPGNDDLHGGAGNDTLDGGGGADVLSGGSGTEDVADYSNRKRNLTITLDDRSGDGARGERDNVLSDIEIVRGGSGDDYLVAPAAPAAVDPNASPRHPIPDQLVGNAGDDTLLGGARNDTLTGGDGNDQLAGGHDYDTLAGDNGDDVLNVNQDGGTADGGRGDDLLLGGDADDRLTGGTGFDTLYGGPGDDTLDGGADTDWLFGNEGSDVLEGLGGGYDHLDGGTGGYGGDFDVDSASYDDGTTDQDSDGKPDRKDEVISIEQDINYYYE